MSENDAHPRLAAMTPLLRLAGITSLSLGGRGPRDAFIFDPHRLAFSAWALGLARTSPALLVTLDRHLDLVPPAVPVPFADAPLTELDRFAREQLDVRNVDHILAAMEAGLLSDVLVIARSSPRGALGAGTWTDRHGVEHRIVVAPNVARVSDGFGTDDAGALSTQAAALLEVSADVALDLDLDCFTTLSDADPSVILPWPEDVISDFLMPAGSEPFWDAVLSKTRVLTFAREPYHVGGLIAGGRLFEAAARVVFQGLLHTDLP